MSVLDDFSLDRLSPAQRVEFDGWMKRLDAEHARRGSPYGDGHLADTTGVECWVGFFEDGYTPEDAMAEDSTYWEE